MFPSQIASTPLLRFGLFIAWMGSLFAKESWFEDSISLTKDVQPSPK